MALPVGRLLTTAVTAEFQDMVTGFDSASLAEVAALAKSGDEDGEVRLAAAMVWAAFCCPAGVRPLYNSIVAAWRGPGEVENAQPGLPTATPDDAFWDQFWAGVEHGREATYTPASATARIAAMARGTGPEFLVLAERCTNAHRLPDAGTDDVDPDVWAGCPEGTLGRVLLDMVEAGTYELDSFDRRELRTLPPRLHRLCTHADRLDGVRRAVLGYDSIDAHLIANCAFTLAQTVHLFSAGALGFFAALTQFVVPGGLPILMRLIAEGWQHGQRAPSLVGVDWQPCWALPIDEVRRRLAVPTYQSVFRKDLFHTLPRYAEASDRDRPEATGDLPNA